MTKRILINIGGHFALGPRPQKEAAAAVKAGFEVFVRGNWWDTQLAKEDLEIAKKLGVEFKPLLDLRHRNMRTRLTKLKHRASATIASCLGTTSARSFGNAGPEMVKETVRMAPDLVMLHSEAGLWAGKKLIKAGYRVGIDFEDWFSEDLPMSDRKSRPTDALKELETLLVRKADPQFATTQCMADALRELAGTSIAPIAIPNAFPWASRPATNPINNLGETVRFYWFSQTIGPHRGLEHLATALKEIEGSWELHLLGNLRNYQEWFNETFGMLGDRVTIHSPVTNQELPVKTATFDIGLALETPYCRNKDVTASNKIFEYLRCGLPVIATDTRGQCEVMSKCPDAGWLVPSNDVERLRSLIQKIVDRPAVLSDARNASLHAAEHVWAWELFEPKLIEGLLRGVETKR
tara:strand:+ start:12728 stop:13951 length:1224 start_codon:yes stop_codon:yes gene_type:complete